MLAVRVSPTLSADFLHAVFHIIFLMPSHMLGIYEFIKQSDRI